MLISFPWHFSAASPADADCIALLGLVRLRGPSLLPTFIQFGFRIERQLRRDPGVIGFHTAADPWNLRFFHVSAWRSREAIDRFVRTAPHLLAVQKLSGRLGEVAFRYWEARRSDLPLRVTKEMYRLSTFASIAERAGRS